MENLHEGQHNCIGHDEDLAESGGFQNIGGLKFDNGYDKTSTPPRVVTNQLQVNLFELSVSFLV